jgi:hypothetical protein
MQNWMRSFFPILLSTIVSAVVALTLWLFLHSLDGSFWQGMELGKAALEPEYCEFNHMEDFIRQPVNSWSNFCYLFLAYMAADLGDTGWHSKGEGKSNVSDFQP